MTISRRLFLGSAAALTAATYARAAGSNERLSVGIVGPGGRGRSLLYTFFQAQKDAKAELTASCDIWSLARERANEFIKKNKVAEPRQFKRLEDMLDAKDLDAIIIATPDHAHAKHLAMCLQAGKHVYCEKPFANTIEDANATIDVCRKSDKVVTLGTQRRSDPHYLAAADTIKTGVLGDIVKVDVVQNALSPFRWRRDADVKLLKETDTDWKAFLMGKPDRPFDARQYLEFRLFREFSSGIIDQWMTHLIDTVHMLAGGTFPKSVVAHGGTYAWKDHRENGDTVQVSLDYPEGFMATYSSTLANGSGSGCRVLGRKATLEYENQWQVSDLAKKGEKSAEPKPIAAKEGLTGNMDLLHIRNWLDGAAKGNKQTNCTPEHGYQHSIACIMAATALRTGHRQTFDPKTRTIKEG